MARKPKENGAAAQVAADDVTTEADFLAYVSDELRPLAESLGYAVDVYKPEAVLDETRWPAWFYDPATGEGAVYERPEDVPPGHLDSPG